MGCSAASNVSCTSQRLAASYLPFSYFCCPPSLSLFATSCSLPLLWYIWALFSRCNSRRKGLGQNATYCTLPLLKPFCTQMYYGVRVASPMKKSWTFPLMLASTCATHVFSLWQPPFRGLWPLNVTQSTHHQLRALTCREAWAGAGQLTCPVHSRGLIQSPPEQVERFSLTPVRSGPDPRGKICSPWTAYREIPFIEESNEMLKLLQSMNKLHFYL